MTRRGSNARRGSRKTRGSRSNRNNNQSQISYQRREETNMLPVATVWTKPSITRAVLNYNSDQVLTIRRTCQLTTMASSTTADVSGNFLFQLADLPGFSDFSALFDQYSIYAVRLRFVPRITETTTGNYGTVFIAADYDDAVNVNLGTIQQYDNVIVQRVTSDKGWSVLLTPHIAVAAYSGAFTSYSNQEQAWIDTSSSTVSHYGVKYVITQATVASFIDVWADYYVKFRGTT